MTEQEKSIQQYVEEQIREKDIRFDLDDQIMFWFKIEDHFRINREIGKRESLGEHFNFGHDVGGLAGFRRGLWGIDCNEYSYPRLLPFIEDLGTEYRVGRIFNKYRVSYKEWIKKWPRGGRIIEVPKDFGERR